MALNSVIAGIGLGESGRPYSPEQGFTADLFRLHSFSTVNVEKLSITPVEHPSTSGNQAIVFILPTLWADKKTQRFQAPFGTTEIARTGSTPCILKNNTQQNQLLPCYRFFSSLIEADTAAFQGPFFC
jgi:hypothetical protein